MRLMAERFGTFDEAEAVRERFPYCGACGATLKVQQGAASYWLRCIENRAHASLSDRSVGGAGV